VLDAATQKALTFGTKGSGGPGGNTNADMNGGNNGIAAGCWALDTNLACN
jgi:hypothetical protein